MIGYYLVVTWLSGEENFYPYFTRDEAERAGRNMRMVFGNHVKNIYTRRAF